MRILFIGDVVGRPGREMVLAHAQRLRRELEAEFVIVNAENAAGGLGVTPEIGAALLERARADVLTLGNHAFAKREAYSYLESERRVLRPANFPPGAPGRGWAVYNSPEGPLAVGVLQGRVFMDPLDDPFREADAILEEAREATCAVFLEFHGEATSEKQAFGWHVDGRASAVVGTHTHVQTADERLLPGGTAYITDAGMTGPRDSVIGVRREVVIPRFTTGLPSKFEVAEGPASLCGVLVDIDMNSGRARGITRVRVDQEEGRPAAAG